MISVSNRRRASRVLTLLLLLLLAGTTAAATTVLRPAPGAAGHPEFAAWFRADAAWLRTVPAPPETLFAGDDVEALSRFLGGRAGGTPLRDTAARLRDRWLERGRLGCRITTAAHGDTLLLTVDPGPAYRLGTLVVAGAEFPGRDAALARTLPRPGDPLDTAAWTRAVESLLNLAADAGHPFAHWIVRRIAVLEAEARVDVEAALTPGPSCVFGPVTSDLPAGRGERFLIKAARLPTGRVFSETELARARERLLQRGLYRSVGEPVVHTTAAVGTVGVYLPVVLEPRPSRAAVVLGLSRAGADEPSRLSGDVDLRLANLAGSGRNLDVRWSDDGRDRSRVGFGWTEPLIGGTPLDAALTLDHEVERGAYTRFRLDGRLQLPVVGAWGVELGGGWDRSTFAAGDWTRSARWRARAALLHRRGDRYRSGWSGTFAVETARRGVDVAPGGTGGGEERQTLLELDLELEQRLGEVLGLAIGGLYREVAADAPGVPLTEQYRLGGARSLRGYLEEQFHGDRVGALRLELRLGRPGRSRVYTFCDLGYVRVASRDPLDDRWTTREDSPRGYGIGLETRSPAGDVSLAVGLPGAIDFDAAKLHVTLLQSF